MSLGQLVQEWSGLVEGELGGTRIELDFAFSNIDDDAPDGLAGPTEVGIEIRLEP